MNLIENSEILKDIFNFFQAQLGEIMDKIARKSKYGGQIEEFHNQSPLCKKNINLKVQSKKTRGEIARNPKDKG